MKKYKKIISENWTAVGKKTHEKLETFQCNWCHYKQKMHSTRMIEHLALKCTQCPEGTRLTCKDLVKDDKSAYGPPSAKRQHSEMSDDEDSDIESVTSKASTSSNVSQRSASRQNIGNIGVESFCDKMSANDQKYAEYLLALAIFSAGVVLSVVANDLWLKLCNFLRPKFHCPSRHILSNVLLEDIYEAVKCEVDQLIANAPTVNVQCDGWTNVRGEGIVNFVVTTPEPVFYHSVAPGSAVEDGEYIAKEVSKVIDKIGADKVMTFVSDNASSMRKAWRILETSYADFMIAAFGCASHILNLLMKDVRSLPSARPVIEKTKSLVNEIKKSKLLAARFSDIQKDNLAKKVTVKSESLKNLGTTRFGSVVTCNENLLNNKHNLQALAICPTVQSKMSSTTKALLLNEEYWNDLQQLTDLLKPVTKWTKNLEADNSKISKVVTAFAEIRGRFESELASPSNFSSSPEEIEKIKKFLTKRENMALRPIHFAANLLDPSTKGANLTSEQQTQGSDYIFNVASRLQLDKDVVSTDYIDFKTDSGIFRGHHAQERAGSISPSKWWKAFYSNTQLRHVATEILSVPPTQTATERTFSTFGWLHSAKRNRLTIRRSTMLTFIAHNLRLFDATKIHEILVKLVAKAYSRSQEHPRDEVTSVSDGDDDDNDSEGDLFFNENDFSDSD